MFATKSAMHNRNQHAIKKETTGLLRATAMLFLITTNTVTINKCQKQLNLSAASECCTGRRVV
jgi:hypothetical protein